MSEELKPCPACGNHNVSHSTETTRIGTYHFVFCEACLLLSGPVRDSKEEAVAAWNSLPRALEWTSEPPKVPGWYWMFCRGEVVIVPCNGVEIMVWGDKIGLDSPELEGVAWAGPIPEPVEARENNE